MVLYKCFPKKNNNMFMVHYVILKFKDMYLFLIPVFISFYYRDTQH